MRRKLMLRNLSMGEVAPELDGLIDGPVQGCKKLENFIVRKFGGITHAPGTYYVQSAISSSAASRLIPFTASDGTGYILEFGNQTLTVFKQSTHAQVASGITTPYASADLADLQYLQIHDSLYITHEDYDPRTLTWTDDSTWTLQIFSGTANVSVIAKTGSSKIQKTTDGITWDEHRLPFDDSSAEITAIVYGDGVTVVGSDGGELVYSYDGGTTWNIYGTVSGSTDRWWGGAYGNGVFVLSNNAGKLAYSTDRAETWTLVDLSSDFTFLNGVAYLESAALFVAAGSGTAAGKQCATSADGASWTTRSINGTSDDFRYVAASDTAFIISGLLNSPSTHGGAFRSTDGINWTDVDPGGFPTPNYPFGVYANGVWHLVSAGSSQHWISADDGETWSQLDDFSGGVNSMIYYKNQDMWIAMVVITTSSYYVSVSTDNGYTFAYNGAQISSVLSGLTVAGSRAFAATGDRPRSITFHGNRLVLGGSRDEPGSMWGSTLSNESWDDFTTGWLANNAWGFTLASRRNVNIRWIESSGVGIVIGSRNGIGLMSGGQDVGITPSSVRVQWLLPHGAANVVPLRIGNRVLFVQRGGEIVRLFPEGTDLTSLAHHITDGGITELDYQDDPQSIVWALRSDGQLLALTMDGNILAWSRRILAGSYGSGDAVVESVAVVPGSDAEDEVWLEVKRTINGSTVRYIEYMAPIEVDTKGDAHFVDAGIEQSGTSTTVTGLSHLEGEEVYAVVDGNIVETHTVASGQITLTNTPTTGVHVGLYRTAKAQLLSIETGSPYGSGAGMQKRTSKLFAWVKDSIGGAFGQTESDTEGVSYDNSSDLFTGKLDPIDFPGDWDDEAHIWIVQSDPLPLTVVAVSPDILVGDL